MHIVPVIGTVRNINIDEVAPAFNFHLKSMHPQTDDHWCNINKFTVLEMGIKPLNLWVKREASLVEVVSKSDLQDRERFPPTENKGRYARH